MGVPAVPVSTGPLTVIRAMASALVSRAKLASAAGLTFAGNRNVYEALGYKLNLNAKDYRDRYRRNALARRIVDAIPQATWRVGAELIEDEDPETSTAFEEAWWELADRLQVWPQFLRADILAGLGTYSALLIGAPGDLDQEMPRMSGPEQVAFLTPFSEADAEIRDVDYVENPEDPRFGLPLFYTFGRLTPSRGSLTSIAARGARRVHWTRVIHVADGLLDDHVHGQPRLEHVWNLLDDLEKVTGAGAEAFWQRAHQGYQFDIDPEVEMDAGDVEDMKDQIDEFVHGFRRAIRTRKVEMTAFGSDTSEFDRNVDAILLQISAGTGIPHRILTGSERGELASTQDRNNWNERIGDRRTAYAEPQVVRPFVDRLIAYGALPEPVEYTVRWPESAELDEKDQASVAKTWAEINEKAGQTVVTADEIRDRVLGLDPLETLEAFDGEEEDGVGDAEEDEGAEPAEDADDVGRAARAKKKHLRSGAQSLRCASFRTRPTGRRGGLGTW